MLGTIGKTVDDNQRGALYVELQRYMQENPPFIYLYEPTTFEATSNGSGITSRGPMSAIS